jgi:AraC-like DNA-binding protein
MRVDAMASIEAPGILASAATGLPQHVARFGGDIDRICGAVAVDPATVGQPTLSLDLQSFCALFEESAKQTQNANFGLWFGHGFKPRDLGLIGYAAVSSPTVGAALENFIALFAYHQQSTHMALADAGNGLIRLEYRIDVADIVARRQDAELSLGMFLNIMREALGPSWSPQEVHFEHPKPEAWHEHESAFDAPVYFAQTVNALVFPRTLFARPMPAPDLKLLSIARMCLMSVGARPVARMTMAGRVRATVRARLCSGYPALEEIASALRATPAAIQRELTRENRSYKDLVEEVRRELAHHYLREQQLPLSEIAFLLGYSELSAFSRAFHRWEGISPREFRSVRS